MLAFILNIVLMLALGTLVFLFVRAIPRVEDEDGQKHKRTIFEKWLVSELPERADIYLSNLFAKWIRKFKIFVMKIDNMLGSHLKKIKPHSLKSDVKTGGFSDMNGEEGEDSK